MMRTKAIMKAAVVAGMATMASAGLLAMPASASPAFYAGEKTMVLYNNSPLRTCNSTACAVMVYMPKSTSLNPGGGYVTFAKDQSGPNWCEVNWKGVVGWTGCWRLDPGISTTTIG